MARKSKRQAQFFDANIAVIAALFAGLVISLASAHVSAQEPSPAAPRSVSLPEVKETKLRNGLTVGVIERRNVPLVTVQLTIKAGASNEDFANAGLANMTASLLTKGTRTRTATQIAEQVEFLGGSISSGAGWNTTVVSINVASDKLESAMAILSDVVLNPSFSASEIEFMKSQIQDGLVYNLKQPGFLANYVAGVYSFDEHPVGGTPESTKKISRAEIVKFRAANFRPGNSTLVFTGDLTSVRAKALGQRFFGLWNRPEPKIPPFPSAPAVTKEKATSIAKRIVVVDLPKSGQAAVNYSVRLDGTGRTIMKDRGVLQSNPKVFHAIVMNSLLGGGYSSRLNQEIRIKRGLSYGAGSSFSWRGFDANFGAQTQTKNESAAEVAEVILNEIRRLTETVGTSTELGPRKLVVTGDFSRELETTGGLAQALSTVYGYGLPASEMKLFIDSVKAVATEDVRRFAEANLPGGDLIIVGDYAIFKEDLQKRLPGIPVTVIKADEVDLTKLRK